ncbi:hypothetical protein ACH4UA_36455, partial [Streptomyces sp. NPDC020939]|uniref:hypothetical protein n=1 Tax=unclassified Streptomyces TaxID=2593676 RepID=UPI0037AC7562
LTFGTLLSSQGTEASFETVSPAPPGFPFVVFPAYRIPQPIHNRPFPAQHFDFRRTENRPAEGVGRR